jgi:glutathione reductase (NADPH)
VPAIDQLDLPAANVETWRRGVLVDEYLRSRSNHRVFAGGDAHGVFQLSPVASYEGRVIARNYLEGDVVKVDYTIVPQAIYTTPPLATVGLTETEARASGRAVKVRTSDMKSWKVYAIAGEPVAWAKVVADAATDRILGAQLFGAGAADNIHLFALAIRTGLTAADLREPCTLTQPSRARSSPRFHEHEALPAALVALRGAAQSKQPPRRPPFDPSSGGYPRRTE